MTFQQFLEKYNGQPVDFDGIYPNQCLDLAHQYVYDVLGLTDVRIIAHPAAYQIYTDFTETQYFDKIANSPTGVPLEGDIVVFGQGVGQWGHVCIFIEGDARNFKSFDANWPTGSLPHVQDHTYGYCLGWLHPKTVVPDLQGQINQLIADRDRNWNYFIAVCEALKVGANVDVAVAEATKLLTMEQTVLEKDRQIADIQTKASDLESQLAIKTQAITEAQTQVATVTVELATAQTMVDDLTAKDKIDQEQLTALKEAAQIKQSVSGFKLWIFNLFFK